MTLPDKVFFTGVPGSRWSAVAQAIEAGAPFNKSDRLPNRLWHPAWMTVGHSGSYFGSGMEFEADLDQDLLAPWYDVSGTKLIKSHEWAYQLDQIIEKFPNDWIMLVYRPAFDSWTSWLESGGFYIPYPNYEYYKDKHEIFRHCQNQNTAILEFSKKQKLSWNHFTTEWVYNTFGYDIDPYWTSSTNLDILVTVYKPTKV